MATTRIHGSPGHLIVERWPEGQYPDDGDYSFGFVDEETHCREARQIYEFFSGHISFQHTIKRLYWILKREFPNWDSEEEPEGLED